MLGKAISIAAQAHENQKDKGGNAYILHPIRIMMRLRTTDEELMTIAILHDVVEDDDTWTLDRLKSEGFSDRVIDALRLLTHDNHDTYERYIGKISSNRDATRIKLEDLRDNSDITRMKGVSQSDLDRMQKYHKSFKYLQSVQSARDLVGF